MKIPGQPPMYSLSQECYEGEKLPSRYAFCASCVEFIKCLIVVEVSVILRNGNVRGWL